MGWYIKIARQIDTKMAGAIQRCGRTTFCQKSGLSGKRLEGRDKPVIYICRRNVFKKASTHFDTNHHLTVMWHPADKEKTADALKATIRSTLPAEAKLQDDSQSGY